MSDCYLKASEPFLAIPWQWQGNISMKWRPHCTKPTYIPGGFS